MGIKNVMEDMSRASHSPDRNLWKQDKALVDFMNDSRDNGFRVWREGENHSESIYHIMCCGKETKIPSYEFRQQKDSYVCPECGRKGSSEIRGTLQRFEEGNFIVFALFEADYKVGMYRAAYNSIPEASAEEFTVKHVFSIGFNRNGKKIYLAEDRWVLVSDIRDSYENPEILEKIESLIESEADVDPEIKKEILQKIEVSRAFNEMKATHVIKPLTSRQRTDAEIMQTVENELYKMPVAVECESVFEVNVPHKYRTDFAVRDDLFEKMFRGVYGKCTESYPSVYRWDESSAFRVRNKSYPVIGMCDFKGGILFYRCTAHIENKDGKFFVQLTRDVNKRANIEYFILSDGEKQFKSSAIRSEYISKDSLDKKISVYNPAGTCRNKVSFMELDFHAFNDFAHEFYTSPEQKGIDYFVSLFHLLQTAETISRFPFLTDIPFSTANDIMGHISESLTYEEPTTSENYPKDTILAFTEDYHFAKDKTADLVSYFGVDESLYNNIIKSLNKANEEMKKEHSICSFIDDMYSLKAELVSMEKCLSFILWLAETAKENNVSGVFNPGDFTNIAYLTRIGFKECDMSDYIQRLVRYQCISSGAHAMHQWENFIRQARLLGYPMTEDIVYTNSLLKEIDIATFILSKITDSDKSQPDVFKNLPEDFYHGEYFIPKTSDKYKTAGSLKVSGISPKKIASAIKENAAVVPVFKATCPGIPEGYITMEYTENGILKINGRYSIPEDAETAINIWSEKIASLLPL